jgi:hypothetical protein
VSWDDEGRPTLLERRRTNRLLHRPREGPPVPGHLQAAHSAGGRAPRVNVQVGLSPAVAEAIVLRDSAGQLAILTATTRALAMGRVSSNTAQAIAVLVKTAAGINAADQSEAIKALEARLESLVVDVTPRGGGR